MTIRSRLLRLERVFPMPEVTIVAPDEPITDEDEGDRVGQLLWAGLAGEKRSMQFGKGQSLYSEGLRAWRQAAELAWSAGHRIYPAELRTASLAVWLEWKPAIMKRRETHGVWVHTGEAGLSAAMTIEEFNQLPLNDRAAILRLHRPGYWSNLGPQSVRMR